MAANAKARSSRRQLPITGSAHKAGNGRRPLPALIGAQDRGQLARRPRINDPLRDLGAVQRHAEEEPQRANDLVQSRPGHPLRDQMHLERADILKPEPVRRAAENDG